MKVKNLSPGVIVKYIICINGPNSYMWYIVSDSLSGTKSIFGINYVILAISDL